MTMQFPIPSKNVIILLGQYKGFYAEYNGMRTQTELSVKIGDNIVVFLIKQVAFMMDSGKLVRFKYSENDKKLQIYYVGNINPSGIYFHKHTPCEHKLKYFHEKEKHLNDAPIKKKIVKTPTPTLNTFNNCDIEDIDMTIEEDEVEDIEDYEVDENEKDSSGSDTDNSSDDEDVLLYGSESEDEVELDNFTVCQTRDREYKKITQQQKTYTREPSKFISKKKKSRFTDIDKTTKIGHRLELDDFSEYKNMQIHNVVIRDIEKIISSMLKETEEPKIITMLMVIRKDHKFFLNVENFLPFSRDNDCLFVILKLIRHYKKLFSHEKTIYRQLSRQHNLKKYLEANNELRLIEDLSIDAIDEDCTGFFNLKESPKPIHGTIMPETIDIKIPDIIGLHSDRTLLLKAVSDYNSAIYENLIDNNDCDYIVNYIIPESIKILRQTETEWAFARVRAGSVDCKGVDTYSLILGYEKCVSSLFKEYLKIRDINTIDNKRLMYRNYIYTVANSM